MEALRTGRAFAEHRSTRRVTAALLAAGLALYALGAFAHPFGGRLDELTGTPLYDGLISAAALVCLARVPSLRSGRLAWSLVGAGLLLWAAADVYSTTVLAGMSNPPYPSLADAGWLAVYPTSYAAMLLLASRRGTRIPPGVWLDGVIAALAAAALIAALLFEPHVEGGRRQRGRGRHEPRLSRRRPDPHHRRHRGASR